jgi:hypothetical protein
MRSCYDPSEPFSTELNAVLRHLGAGDGAVTGSQLPCGGEIYLVLSWTEVFLTWLRSGGRRPRVLV